MDELDPLARLEQAAARQDKEERSAKAVEAARAGLVMQKSAAGCFFATLALRLVPEVSWETETLATDGKKLVYNPDFTLALSKEQLLGVVVHEVMHNAMAHMATRGPREPAQWNIAADLSINPLIREAGYQLPPQGLFPGEGMYAKLPVGKSAEEYYALLDDPPPMPPKPGQAPPSSQDPGGCGGVQEPGQGDPSDTQAAQAEWEVAVAQAHQVAKKRGSLPGGLNRMVAEVLQPKVDWRAVLREFLSRQARSDYRWNPPNRRFLPAVYLPGLRSEELGDVVVAVDTSGSIGEPELKTFAGELQGILDGYDCTATILYHDSKICHVQTWRSSDGPLVLEAKGGGGTSHVPVFDWIDDQGEMPAALVCFTDMESQFPDRAPSYPVLWAALGARHPKAPFGQLVEVS